MPSWSPPTGRWCASDEHENRDLLWGLRGGGGNFGVVTVFEYRVDPVGPIVLGGNLVYPADRGLEVISAWQELVDSASDDLGTGIHFYVMPDIPYVPAELRNQPVVSIFVCHAGTVQEAEREIAPLRELAPAADMLEPMPYTTVQALSDAVLPPGQRNYWKAENLTDLTTAGITALISGAVDLAVTSPLGVVALYPKGRAITRVDGDSAALDGRASPYSVYAWSLWPSAEDDELNIGRTRSLFRRDRGAPRHRRLCQLLQRAGRRRFPAVVRSGRAVSAPGRPQASVRSGERVPSQPQHRSCGGASACRRSGRLAVTSTAFAVGTPFAPRTESANRYAMWLQWFGYLVADVYTSYEEELDAIRNRVAMNEMSPLQKYRFTGPDAHRFTDRLVTRDLSAMEVGQVMYTPWCDHDGKVVCDGLVFRIGEQDFRISGGRLSRWLEQVAEGFDVEITDETADLAILALQGPALPT